MQSRKWDFGESNIQIGRHGVEIEFSDMEEFLNALVLWQEIALSQQAGEESLAEGFWDITNRDSLN